MEPVDLFYSYAHEDEPLRDELAGHLKIMERRGVIRPWHDRCLAQGQTWDQEINTQLATADLVLLLVSADFINSDYIWGKELNVAMKRHASKEASVVPVMLRSVDITDAPFAALQGLPTDLRPVTSWPNRDEAWTDVAKGIRRTVEQIQAGWTEKRPPMPAAVGFTRGGSATPSTPSGASDDISRPILGTGDMVPPEVGEPASDPILERVLREVSTQVTQAARARGIRDIDPAKAQRYALTLIDAPDQKRILWVDNCPENNRFETAAFAKLQIEVVAVTSTDAALARIASDPEPFDLVLSDWQRPELHLDTLSAGIHLLRELRTRHLTMPVVFYHGSSKERDRTARRELALREGAFGEAVMPDELLGLVISALGLD
ncbi:MAG: TIR domain-containing protein [Nitrospirales bacterium]|nr:TIR domain-containing protein [Nitrospirales bacterium]